ncbi:MAG TPA: hypothetical protein VJQ56_11290 [Blastocatellia bacterium]|nr:hypothetical protein [Blastocatellia bacterium]
MEQVTIRGSRVCAVCLLGLLLLSPLETLAQDRNANRSRAVATQSAPPASNSQAVAAGAADVSITARVTAREMKFEVVPNPRVEFPGTFERANVWEAVRENFPNPVEPGVTYRNIGVTLTITTYFSELERIVEETVGDVSTRKGSIKIERPRRPEPVAPINRVRRSSGGQRR